jgi:hypothetical protein
LLANLPRGHPHRAASKALGQLAASHTITVSNVVKQVSSQLEEIKKLAKLCSLSSVGDSVIMWSHYADHHKGFCIEYDLEPLKPEHPFRHNLYPVAYSENLYDLRPYAEQLVAKNREEFHTMYPLLAMLHKFDGWSYEHEWRLISKKRPSSKIKNSQHPPRHDCSSAQDSMSQRVRVCSKFVQ